MFIKRCIRHGDLTIDQCKTKGTHVIKYYCIQCGSNLRQRPLTRDAEGQCTDKKGLLYETFFDISNKLVKITAQHYQLHRRFKKHD